MAIPCPTPRPEHIRKREMMHEKEMANKRAGIGLLITILILILICYYGLAYNKASYKPSIEKQSMDYFLQYDNATTLVIIEYGEETFEKYNTAYGFIDNVIYQEYKDNECSEEKITIYDPYVKGQETTIEIEKIAKITKTTKELFYDRYKPDSMSLQ